MHARSEVTFRATGDVLVKADVSPGSNKLWIQGILSTESRDADGETVLQNGLDFDYFLKSGWFNDNHDQSTGSGLGFPTAVERVTHNGKPATRVVGYLLPTPKGIETYHLAKAAAAAGRPLGFSIEGGIIQRTGPDGKVVARAIVRDCAIARHPKNSDTSLDVLVKALKTGEIPDSYRKSTLTAGYGGPAGDGGSGAAYVPQSLDGSSASSTAPLSMADALRHIQKELGVSAEKAKQILQQILKGKGKNHGY